MRTAPIPRIPELRLVVAKSEEKYGKIPWVSKKLIHPHVSIHLTRLFLLGGFSGIHVTFMMAALAVGGALVFFIGGQTAYLVGAGLMMASWILDHSDGEVRRYLGQDSNFGVFLDRFAHRVSYPLVHLGMGVSLARENGQVQYLILGAMVAYFWQLTVAHSLDKALIQLERGGVERYPLRVLRTALSRRAPQLAGLVYVAIGCFAQLVQNWVFLLLLSVAALLDAVEPFYVAYGVLVIAHWSLVTTLDFVLLARSAEQSKVRAASPSDAVPMGTTPMARARERRAR